jgi:hypothetical protein
MKQTNDDAPFNGLKLPDPGNPGHQPELKIPLLRYRRSSWAGLWLLVLPLSFFLTAFVKYRFGASFFVSDGIGHFFAYLSGHPVLNLLIPLIFLGLPLAAMIVNGMAICHFASLKEKRELLVTIKYRPFNIAVFLISFVVFVWAFMPDALP